MTRYRIPFAAWLLAAWLIVAAMPGAAQEDISGIWSGALPVAPDTTIDVHFVLTREPDGGYSAVLTSPDPGGIQDIPATSTRFEDNRLVLTVDELDGRYEGVLENGGFAGNWHQQDTEIPLDLVPYVERELSDAAKAELRGSWVGDLEIAEAGITLAIVLRFEDDEDGEFIGYLDSPDQGANGIPVSGLALEDSVLELEVPQIVAEYTAELDGDVMDGTFSQVGQGRPLLMTRGDDPRRISAERLNAFRGRDRAARGILGRRDRERGRRDLDDRLSVRAERRRRSFGLPR